MIETWAMRREAENWAGRVPLPNIVIHDECRLLRVHSRVPIFFDHVRGFAVILPRFILSRCVPDNPRLNVPGLFAMNIDA
jgi:hypothetical protein